MLECTSHWASLAVGGLLLCLCSSRHAVNGYVITPSSLGRTWSSSSSSTLKRMYNKQTKFGARHQNSWLLSSSNNKGGSSNNNDQSGNENNDEPLFFDDFGGSFIGGDDTSSSTSSSSSSSSSPLSKSASSTLQSRLQQAQQEKIQQSTKLSKHWQTGNWQVRGFDLNNNNSQASDDNISDDDKNTDGTVIANFVCLDYHFPTSVLWVGQNDGSVTQVQLGETHFTRFNSDEEEELMDEEIGDGKSPFEILQQIMLTSSGAGTAGDNNISVSFILSTDSSLWVAYSKGGTTGIQMRKENSSQYVDPIEVDMGTISSSSCHVVSVHAVDPLDATSDDPTHVLATFSDATVAMWDIDTGKLVTTCSVSADSKALPEQEGQQSFTVVSADASNGQLFLGTKEGYVLGILVSELLDSAGAITPRGLWRASESTVTSVRCGGQGTLDRRQQSAETAFSKSQTVFTGDDQGSLRQWEILSRSRTDESTGKESIVLDHWPKLPTQKLPKQAHIISSGEGYAITAIAIVDATTVISASADGIVTFWNRQGNQSRSSSKVTTRNSDSTASNSRFSMYGFTDTVSCLVLVPDSDDDPSEMYNFLVTNGMGKLISVHDFDNVPMDESLRDSVDLDYDDW